MENIEIFDYFLSENDLKYIKTFVKKSSQKYGHTSGHRDSTVNVFFSHFISDDFINIYLKNKIENYAKKEFILNRSYFHSQSFGLDGMYHTDSINADSRTFCLYINNIDENEIEHMGGEFLIKTNESHIICVAPKNNRGILFPGNFLHKGMAFNSMCKDDPRICITWKFDLKQIT